MTEYADNMIHQQVRDNWAALGQDVCDIAPDANAVDWNAVGVAIVRTMVAGHVPHDTQRVGTLEVKCIS